MAPCQGPSARGATHVRPALPHVDAGHGRRERHASRESDGTAAPVRARPGRRPGCATDDRSSSHPAFMRP
jgi:hypothetical protein